MTKEEIERLMRVINVGLAETVRQAEARGAELARDAIITNLSISADNEKSLKKALYQIHDLTLAELLKGGSK